MTAQRPIPFRPDYSAVRTDQAKSFWRSVTALAISKIEGKSALEIIERAWGRDESAAMITRAASSAMDTTASSGGSIVPIAVTGLVTGLAQSSAAMKLFGRCARVDFAKAHQIVVPRVVSSTAPVFIAPGASHTVVQSAFGNVLLGPADKFLVAAVVTGELNEYTPDTAVTIVQKALGEKAAATLDALVFDAVAATAGTRPAGLLNSVNDVGATSGGGLVAAATDIGKLCGAMSTAGVGSDDVLFVANPAEAKKLQALTQLPRDDIVGSSAIAAGTVVGISLPAVVSGFSGIPEIDVSISGAVQMEDASPTDIVVGGVVNAGTVKSFYQSNLIGIRLRMRLSWGVLISGAVQKVLSVTW
jgi:hypothetical protein